jgi:hypothetical protein
MDKEKCLYLFSTDKNLKQNFYLHLIELVDLEPTDMGANCKEYELLILKGSLH